MLFTYCHTPTSTTLCLWHTSATYFPFHIYIYMQWTNLYLNLQMLQRVTSSSLVCVAICSQNLTWSKFLIFKVQIFAYQGTLWYLMALNVFMDFMTMYCIHHAHLGAWGSKSYLARRRTQLYRLILNIFSGTMWQRDTDTCSNIM